MTGIFTNRGWDARPNPPAALPTDLVQPAPAPFGDVTLEIRPPRARVRDNPAVQIEYDLQPLAEMQRLALVQDNLTETAISSDSLAQIARALEAFIAKVMKSGAGMERTKTGAPAGASWIRSARSTLEWLEKGIDNAPSPSPIFAQGNSKLPYWAFSALPGVTCPGAGLCLRGPGGSRGWCYSFRAWRYPAAFFRQFNNTLLLRTTERRQVRQAFGEIAALGTREKPVVTRLYVDGDMDSLRTLRFWMGLLHENPTVRAYGYSKSWQIFLKYDEINRGRWPDNYVLNLSSGSKFDRSPRYLEAMQALPITRGRFVATPIHKVGGKKIPQNLVDAAKLTAEEREIFAKGEVPAGLKESVFRRNPDYTAAVKESAAKNPDIAGKVFVCPGKCGNCLGAGRHACGLTKDEFDGPIVIGIH